MLNELEEFWDYTERPCYWAEKKSDTTYMGRFTLPMLQEFTGFHRILTILARGYLFRDGGNGYGQLDYARRALLAWCSVSSKNAKNAPDRDDPRRRVNFGEYAAEFPELVTPEGDGWLVRHLDGIAAFANKFPEKVRKGVPEKIAQLKKGFRKQWAKRVLQMQVPIFAANTKGAWMLHFDAILADALELGPLQNRDFELPEDIRQRLSRLTPYYVSMEVSTLLCKYYLAHRADAGASDPSNSDDPMQMTPDSDAPAQENPWVVLPCQNFNAYFGNTGFSQKWLPALTNVILDRKTLNGVCKYRIRAELL